MSSIRISADLGPLQHTLSEIANIGRKPEKILDAIGLEIEDNVSRRFQTNLDPNGSPWVPLNRQYAASRKPGPILVQTGALERSTTSEVHGYTIIVRNWQPYAAVHQFGATITPRINDIHDGDPKKALHFKYGAKSVFAKKVVIPARPYLGFGFEDRRAVEEQLHEALRLALIRR